MEKYRQINTFAFLFVFLLVPGWVQAEKMSELTLLEVVTQTLARQPAIHIQREQVEIGKGALQAAGGQFDWQSQFALSYDRQETPLTNQNKQLTGKSTRENGITGYSLTLNRQFRSGISIQPGLEVTRNEDKTFDSDTLNNGSIDFTVVMPLIKGRGRNVVTAGERAAQADLDGSELDLIHIVSQSVFRTVQAYWNYLAAQQQYTILQKTEERAGQLLRDVKKLIEADERPASDADQLLANLSDKTSGRIAAEQQLVAARHELGLAIGLPYTRFVNLLGAADAWPDPRRVRSTRLTAFQDMINIAISHRRDLAAVQKRKESARLLLLAVSDERKPQMDFYINSNLAGLDEGGGVSKAFRFDDAASFEAGIQFRYPLGNNQAVGTWIQQRSLFRRTQIETAEITRTITSNVSVALNAVRHNLQALLSAQKTVDSYRKALEIEKTKMRLGMATVIDVINTDDRLQNALLTEVNNRLLYANALAGLRFETGTLLDSAGKKFSVNAVAFSELPDR